MKTEVLLHSIGKISDELIAEAEKMNIWRRSNK